MYFWNITKLEKDLKKGLSQKQDMKYLMALIIILMLGWSSYGGGIPNMYDYITGVIMFVYALVEILYLFKLNKWGKGENFLSRYLSVGLVCFVRSLVFIWLPLIILLSIVLALVYGLDQTLVESTFLDLVFIVLYSLWYIYIQAQSFKRINKK